MICANRYAPDGLTLRANFLRSEPLKPIRPAWHMLRSLVNTSKTSIRSLGYFYGDMLSLLQAHIPAIYSRYSDCIFVGVTALLIFLHLTTPSELIATICNEGGAIAAARNDWAQSL
jgi:hypothetical protein